MALTAIVQNIRFLMPYSDSSLQAVDLRADPMFWDLLRQLLVSRHKAYSQVCKMLQVYVLQSPQQTPKLQSSYVSLPAKCTDCECSATNTHTVTKYTLAKSCKAVQVDDNAFTRKQGLFVLEHAVRNGAGGGRQAWQAVLHLLALLEDFALHLIKVNP